jgi:cell division protein ZipA
MNSNIQLILLSIVGFVVLVTFILSMRVRQKHQRLYQERRVEPATQAPLATDDFDIIPISPTKKIAPYAPQVTNENIRAYSELGFHELGDIFAESPPPTASLTPVSHPVPKKVKQAPLKSSGLVILYLMARPGQKFIGYELLQALLAAGLRFGDMSIFHRYQQPTGQGLTLFSLASATEPGTFDMNKMGAFACQGLTLFMNLTGPEHNLAALETLLNTTQQLADDLQGVIMDDRRVTLSPERVIQFQALVQKHMEQFA